MRIFVRFLAGLAISSGVLLPGAASAAAGVERIVSYDVVVQIQTDGSLAVTETITYDFGDRQAHGIYRDIPTRLHYDDRNDRVYPLDVVSVSSSAPEDYEVTDAGNGLTRIKIGDADRTISGVQTYEIRYAVLGALNGFADHDELYWNAIGDQWGVPIDRVNVTVMAPSGIQRAACFTGPTGSTTPCLGAQVRGDTAGFGDRRVAPYEGVTVVVAIPTGVVAPPPQPILEERLTLANAFRVTSWTLAGSGALLVVLFVPLGLLLWRTGRDRRFRGSPVDAVMGGSAGEEAVPLGHADDAAPVEFAPPEGLRPGQVGTVIDERANVLDVAATIVDLAVRGHLQIRELPKQGWFSKPDWQFLQLDKREELLRYERSLLDGLFRDGSDVLLSQLRTTFVQRLADVQEALYDDAVGKGWFTASPEKVRTRWRAIGLVGLVAGAGLTWVLARAHLGLVGLPISAAGLLLLVGASRMPARTAKGTAVAMRIRGFRTVIEVSETYLSRWAEQENVFTRYLPYAIVFGCTDKWAATFAALGDAPAQESLGWYVAARPIVFSDMAEAMDGFTVATSGTLTSTPAGSGNSGFGGGGSSGGGGGGGGGGSW